MCMYKISTISPAMYKISTVSPTMYMYKISTISPASCMYSIKEDINAHSTLSQNSSETLRFAGADSTVCQAVLSAAQPDINCCIHAPTVAGSVLCAKIQIIFGTVCVKKMYKIDYSKLLLRSK